MAAFAARIVMTTTSDISVLIPVHNGARHIGAAIDSCLSQITPAREIIVVDDGSDDSTVDVVTAFGTPVVLMRQAWAGAAAALNAGIARARTDLIAILDHDDVWLPNKLSIQTGALAGDNALDAVFGHVQQFICPQADGSLRARLRCPSKPQPGLLASALLVRRNALDRHGPFRGGRDATAFLDWFVRAREAGLRFSVPDEIVVRRRLHADNSGLRQKHVNREQYLDLSRDMILRHRSMRSSRLRADAIDAR